MPYFSFPESLGTNVLQNAAMLLCESAHWGTQTSSNFSITILSWLPLTLWVGLLMCSLMLPFPIYGSCNRVSDLHPCLTKIDMMIRWTGHGFLVEEITEWLLKAWCECVLSSLVCSFVLGGCTPRCTCGGQRTVCRSWFSSLPITVLGTEPRSLKRLARPSKSFAMCMQNANVWTWVTEAWGWANSVSPSWKGALRQHTVVQVPVSFHKV